MNEKDPPATASQIAAQTDPTSDEASITAAAALVQMKEENIFPEELDAELAARELPPARELAIRRLILSMTDKLAPRRGTPGRGARDN